MNNCGGTIHTISLVVIAISGISITVLFYWLAKNLVDSSASLKNLIESINRDVTTTVQMLQDTIKDVSEITEKVGAQTDRLDEIVDNAKKVSEDVKSTTGMVNSTVVPTLGNLHAVSAGVRKALDTWNNYGGKKNESED